MISNNFAAYGGGVAGYDGVGGYPFNFTNCVPNNCLLISNSAAFGGGAFASQLNNCLICSNRAFFSSSSIGGGGVEGGLLNNCSLIGNVAGQGAQAGSGGGADGSSLRTFILNNCTLEANTSAGPGSGANYCTLNQCSILNNTAGGSGGGAANSGLNNCLISSNLATLGGGTYSSSLTNCILAYNVGNTNGGGAFQSALVNCTVAFNSAGIGGGILDCLADNCILYYNIGGDYFYTNLPPLFYPFIGQRPLNYCCASFIATSGLATNSFDVITNAPLFVNLAGNDFHLQSTSSCINSGNNSYISSLTDLDGNSRIQGVTVDIGAYEYQTPTSVISYAYLQQYGLPTDGSVDFADLDGTAFNVYQDWIAGLNPTNSASVLAMIPVSTNSTSGFTVTWQSASGILYHLQRSTNLFAQPAFTTLQTNIVGQSGTTSYMDTSATNNIPYFYRVGTP